MAVYTGNAFPPEFSNAVFFADYTLGFIRYLTMDPTYTSVIAVHDFDLNAGTPVQLEVGPDGVTETDLNLTDELSLIAINIDYDAAMGVKLDG